MRRTFFPELGTYAANFTSAENLNFTILFQTEVIIYNPNSGVFQASAKNVHVQAEGSFSSDTIRVVIVNNCNERPGYLPTQQTWQVDLSLLSGVTPMYGPLPSESQIDFLLFNSDYPATNCTQEIALVHNGVWQTDPVSGTHNFEVNLAEAANIQAPY